MTDIISDIDGTQIGFDMRNNELGKDRRIQNVKPTKTPRVKLSCSIDGCNNKHAGHGYCAKHGYANKIHGDPLYVRELVVDWNDPVAVSEYKHRIYMKQMADPQYVETKYAYNGQYYIDNKSKVLETQREYRNNHKESRRQWDKAYYIKNKEEHNKTSKAYYAERKYQQSLLKFVDMQNSQIKNKNMIWNSIISMFTGGWRL